MGSLRLVAVFLDRGVGYRPSGRYAAPAAAWTRRPDPEGITYAEEGIDLNRRTEARMSSLTLGLKDPRDPPMDSLLASAAPGSAGPDRRRRRAAAEGSGGALPGAAASRDESPPHPWSLLNKIPISGGTFS